MEVPSSIFSSEKTMPKHGFPWAVALAIILVLGLEIFFRVQDSKSLVQYGTGLGAYYEVIHTIETQGAAEIAVLGSSRGRESIVMPQLKEMVSSNLDRDVTVANYSCPDGKADEMLLVSEMLLESNPKPSLIIYFVSPRILQGNKLSMMRREIFGEFPNQYGQQNKFLLASWSERPLWDLRNLVSENYLTFRHRYRVRNFFVSTIRNRQSTSPVQGQLSTWQIYTPNRNLINRPVNSSHIQAFVQRLLSDKDSSAMNPVRIQALHETVLNCQKAGVELILVAAPLSDPLLKEFPPEYYSNFLGIIKSLQNETGVAWVTAEQLGISLGLEEYREQSHLNLSGAKQMTEALVVNVVLSKLDP